MNTLESLKYLYTQLGGAEADVAGMTDNLSVLNAISLLQEGNSDAMEIAEAVANIAEVASGGGGEEESNDYLDLIQRNSINVVVPQGAIRIGSYAFAGCSLLKTIEIPATVSRIGQSPFINCGDYLEVTIHAVNPPIMEGVGAFNGTTSPTIYVPAESVSLYKSAANWSTYANSISAIPES